ncbi:hypothetical protein [Nostoc sp. TCL26-01]|uniref:hypothetical protein n=1 Tax=Nostoc sp. TCL26-01 TaxID=2576904 RepID=UPI0015B95EC1|nr:hypothetical protein [Nostoc sp. TCL26-01]QLE56936.1 hypothetical protein FD725_16280 [Nostoc sp. TCL26-01]
MQVQKSTKIAAKQTDKYVLALVSVLTLFAVSFVTAIFRVSQSSKYDGLHLNSWSLGGQQQQKLGNSR